MPNYVRAFVPGGTFFFTVNLLERKRKLLTDHIAQLRGAFSPVRQQKPFVTMAYVILSDCLHGIWRLLADDTDFSSRWQSIKANFARNMPKGERLSARRVRKGERGIWQRRFWEHTIRDEVDFERHVDYIHFNPVKHSHAKSTRQWPHWSFHAYVSRGVYSLDWAAGGDVRNLDWE